MKTRSLLDLTTSLNLSRQVCRINTCSSQVCRGSTPGLALLKPGHQQPSLDSTTTTLWTPLDSNTHSQQVQPESRFIPKPRQVRNHPQYARTPSQPPLTHGPPLARTTLRTDHLQRTDHPAHGPPKFTTPAHGPLPNPNFTKFNT
jgi:hypothetical protein